MFIKLPYWVMDMSFLDKAKKKVEDAAGEAKEKAQDVRARSHLIYDIY